jgi:predicted protein tyrosine phosphatase
LRKKGKNKLKKVLFVCSGNIHRSQTAEHLLKGAKGLEVRSAGTLPLSLRVVSRELVNWADIIFAMEGDHKEAILHICSEAENKIIVLDIPDRYLKDDPQLLQILRDRLYPYLGPI